MKTTDHLKLKKPDLTDYVNVEDLNENADIIDEAINENKDNLTTHKADYAQLKGDLSTLKTTAKDSIPNIVNELFTNVSDGKDLIGGAITDVDENVVIPTEPTFNDLAVAIGQISTGKKWAEGVNLSVTKVIPNLNGNNLSRSVIEINTLTLDFNPRIILVYPEIPDSNDRYISTWFNFNYYYMTEYDYGNSFYDRTVYRTPIKGDGLALVPVNTVGLMYKWYAFE